MNVKESIPRSVCLAVLWRCHIEYNISGARHYEVKSSRCCWNIKVNFNSTGCPINSGTTIESTTIWYVKGTSYQL